MAATRPFPFNTHHEDHLLSEVPQLGQLIQQLLQLAVGDFVLQTRNKRLGLLRIVAAQTS